MATASYMLTGFNVYFDSDYLHFKFAFQFKGGKYHARVSDLSTLELFVWDTLQ